MAAVDHMPSCRVKMIRKLKPCSLCDDGYTRYVVSGVGLVCPECCIVRYGFDPRDIIRKRQLTPNDWEDKD